MPKRATGRYERTTVGGEAVAAFVPHPLPPTDPPIVVDAALAERLRAAEQALVRLELAGEMVPSLDWFIYAFVRKEAVLSSQIEGTKATLVDLLTFEAQNGTEQNAAPNADVEEVCNYLDALAYARSQLAEPTGLTLSMRLLSEAHERLMRGVRGAEKLPGEVRRSQNWIGGSRPGNAGAGNRVARGRGRPRRDDRQEARPLVRVPELPRATPRRHGARHRTGIR